MVQALTRGALLALVLFSPARAAEPIKLKLAFPTSDRSALYLHAVKPFVDAVNNEAEGLIRIEVYFSGALGGRPRPRLLIDGVADMAAIVPGECEPRFPDDTVLKLPGLFDNAREATLTYTRLIEANALSGYQDFYVIGAFSAGPANIHSRKPLSSLAGLRGMTISATSTIEATVLERLGAISRVSQIPYAMDAISAGNVDGAAVPPSAFIAFGIARVTAFHYLLPVSLTPLALIMDRETFDALPEQAKNIIRKYSGAWMAEGFVAHWQVIETEELERITSNHQRKVTVPSPLDLESAQAVFRSVSDEWAAQSPRNSQLLRFVKEQLAEIRSPR